MPVTHQRNFLQKPRVLLLSLIFSLGFTDRKGHLCVDVGSSESSLNAQIFNHSKVRKKIKNFTLGLPPPEPLGEGGPNLHYFLLGANNFALMLWIVKPYTRRQLTREDRIVNYSMYKGRRVVENAFGILVSRFRVLLGTMDQRPKGCQRH